MSAQGPAHDRLVDSAASYALGALTASERVDFEAHLRECAECQRLVRELQPAVAALPYGAPDIAPPPGLRDRVLAIAKPTSETRGTVVPFKPRTFSWVAVSGWLSAAALLIVAVGATGYALSLRRDLTALGLQLNDTMERLARSEEQLATTVRALGGAQTRVAMLMAPDLLRVDLKGQQPAPNASGRGFWSRNQGLVFAASALPPLPADRVYQLWVLPTAGAPISAGLLSLEPNGSASTAVSTPPDLPTPAGLAVSIEPTGGVPAPTGQIYLAGTAE